MILSYPVTSPTSIVTLLSPDYGDTKAVDTFALIRETRHKEVKSLKAATWPTTETYSYFVSNSNKTVKDQFQAFLILTAGLLVKLVDYNSVTRTGYIVSDPIEIVTVFDEYSYDINFDFMVVL